MEELLGNALAKQLAGFCTLAGGQAPAGVDQNTL
jgi:hypothetical protein